MTGEKVTLRAVEPSDIEIIHRWENDQNIWRLSDTLVPYSRYQIEQYVLQASQDIFTTKQIRLMINRNDQPGNPTAGAIDLFSFEPMHRRAGVGILIDPMHRNEGLASEAIHLVKAYAFGTLQLHQLYCNISPDNEASLKVFQNNGFVINGTFREWTLAGGTWTDELFLQCMNPIK